MLSKEVTESFLKKSQNIFQRSHKKLYKEVIKGVTVTHICRLFTDKSGKGVLQKASQNCDDRLKLAFFGHCDQMRHLGNVSQCVIVPVTN
jgi:hypothetical protein